MTVLVDKLLQEAQQSLDAEVLAKKRARNKRKAERKARKNHKTVR